jgi:hypothetical protein
MTAIRLFRSVSDALIVVACFVCPAKADLPPPLIFGLNSFDVTPLSGVATTSDVLTIDMGGVAGSSLTPQDVTILPVGPFQYLIDLSNPYDLGATVLTPWTKQAMLGPLAAGSYDFFVSSTTGTSHFVRGPELALEGFIVVPEPAAAWLLLEFGAICRACRRHRR